MKACLIIKREEAEWISCKSIQANLIESYKLAFQDIQLLEVDDSFVSYPLVTKQIEDGQYDIVIVLDYRINISQFFTSVSNKNINTQTKFFIHVYGDFVLRIKDWNVSQDILDRYSIIPICASNAQKNLVEDFLQGNQDFVQTSPFPVDTSVFHYNAKTNKEKIFSELRIPLEYLSKEVVLFTGRLSYQKNILELISAFKKYNQITNNKSILILAGGFDNIILPYQDYNVVENFYENMVLEELDSSIIATGSVNQSILNELYSIANSFISISTYNDEDYGMSVAEALVTGLPCALTTWGGFNDFLMQDNTFAIAIGDTERRPLPLQASILKALIAVNQKMYERTEFSKEMNLIYSVENIAKTLKNIIFHANQKWTGYKDQFYKFNNQSTHSTHFLNFTDLKVKKSYSDLYYEVYDRYLQK